MTIAELIKALQELPQDMKIQVMGSDEGGPVDIVQISRGSWVSEFDGDDEDIDDGGSWCSMIDPEDAEFIQDDENGDVAILVTW